MGIRVDGALWVGRLTDELIADHVDWPTFARGQGYAESDHVTSIVPGDHGRVLLAEVLGHGPVAYTTICSRTSSADAATPTWTGRCSCPMRTDCKHTVAVLLAAREHLLGRSGADSAAPVRDWSTALAPLVAEGPPQRDEVGAPLGLIVDLVDPAMTRYGERPRRRVVLRPTRHTRAGMWSKTTTWPELDATGYHQVTVRTDHRNALAPILRLYRSGARGSYAYGNPEVVLDDLGPAIWPLLRGVRAAGVEIMRPPGTPGGVVIGADYGSVVLDVRVAGDDLAVTPSLLDGSGHTMDLGPRSWFLGEPSHGVVRVVGNDVHLIELAAPVPEAVRTLVLDGRPLRVPAEDIDSFLALYLPALRRNTTVVSGDGSVTFPEKAPPVLHVRVGSPSAHTVQVELGFGYAAGTRLVVVPAAAAGGPTARDRDAESALVESLDELDEVDLRIAPERFGSGHWRAVPRLELTGLDALRFVESTLPALEERPEVVVDIDGELPAYEQVVEAPLVRVGTSERGDGIVTDGSQQDWFDLHISVEVGGEEVPFEPLFQALVRGDEVMVLASGSYFRLDVPELDRLRELIEEARELIDPRSRGLRLTRFHVGLWEELVALGVVDQQSARWAASASALRDLAGRAAPPLPDGLDATLRPYQHEGYGWLSALWDARLGGILADDMGLGKTLQALAMIQRAHERGELAAGPFLVVAPTSVVGTWASEAARFTPGLRVVPVIETGRRRGQELSEVVAGAQVVVTSYALLRIDDASYRELPWSGLILDEAQFVKNHQSKTYQAARRLGAPFTLAITGTPLENSLMDLWSMLSLAAPGLYPSPERFTRNYRKPIESGERPELLDRLRARVRPLMLRRTKDQVASDLPPKQEQVVHVPLAPQHERIYGRHLQRERQKVLGLLADPNGNRVAILRSLTMLRQLALHPGLVDPAYADVTSAKVEVLVELLGEVAAEGHRALVFSQFTSFLRLVRARLEAEGIATCYLDGRTRDRERRIDEFRSGTAPAFLISLKAGGFGLTLTEADYVFVLDPWWNPAAEAQAVDRAHRIGQDKHVMVYRLVSAATIEEKVVALQERKRDLFTRVVDGGALRSGTLSAADIAALLGPA